MFLLLTKRYDTSRRRTVNRLEGLLSDLFRRYTNFHAAPTAADHAIAAASATCSLEYLGPLLTHTKNVRIRH